MTPAVRKRILLAELDDRLAISLLARLYEHNRYYDVLLSRTADVTRALLQTERFSVAVTHAHPSKPGDVAHLESELRAKGEQHPIEETGRELRKLMAWVKDDDSDYTEGTATR